MRRFWIGVVGVFLLLSLEVEARLPVAPPPSPPSVEADQPAPPLPDQPSMTDQVGVVTAWGMPLFPLAPEAELREQAENLDHVTVQPAVTDYPVVQSIVVIEGNSSFHLAHPGFVDHLITLNTPVAVQADSRAFFKSRLRAATEDQVARFQVSANGGISWDTLWSQAGGGWPGESFFRMIEIDLSAYEGQILHLRFHYDFMGGSAFTQTESTVGWFIDDIQVGSSFITRPYTGVGEPTALEILAVEYINRARADAAAEAERLRNDDNTHVTNAVNFFGVDFDEMENQFSVLEQVVPPLAINERLMAAARLHSQDMFDNVFQGHSSSDHPPPPHQPGDSPAARASHQGYTWGKIRENVYAYGYSVWHSHAAYNIDWGPGTWHGMQDPPGHREAIHDPEVREVGIGIIEGENDDNGNSVGPMLSTQKFAFDQQMNQPFLVGVTYVEHDEAFYDIEQALAGVSVSVDGVGFHATSSVYGAYAIPLPGNGSYNVTFTAPGYVSYAADFTVTNHENVKIDFIAQADEQAIWLEAVSRRPDGGLRFEVEYPGDIGSLQVRVSSDLEDWSTIGAIWTALGNDRYQVDCNPVAGPIQFFKVTGE